MTGREKQVSITLNEEEYEHIKVQAKSEGRSMASYCRRKSLGE